MNLKNWRKFLPIIGILLFVYILYRVNLVEILIEIKQANYYYLVLSIIFVIILMLVQTFKWYILAVFQKIKIPYFEAFKINIISNFYGFVTPSKIGGIIRAEYMKKYSDDKIGKGLFNFTIDKMLDISSLILMAILFSFIYKDKLRLPMSIFITIFLIFVLITLFFIKKERSKHILGFFYRKVIPKKMKERAKITFDSFYEDIPKKRYFVLFFSLNFLTWIVAYGIAYFIGLSLGIGLPFIYYLAIFPLGTLITLIPISVNGLGTREAILITLFGLFDIAASKVFSMSIINLFVSGILPAIFAGFIIF